MTSASDGHHVGLTGQHMTWKAYVSNIKQASKTQETSKQQEIMKSYAAAVRPDSVAEE